jgi:guanine nucleotide-binding protein subunit beta-2-like 1 protein
MEKKLSLKTTLYAHSGWITSISVALNDFKIFATGSRDLIINIWEIKQEKDLFAIIKKRLRGHSHFISDIVLSPDAKFCISSSWDKSLRLWDLNTYKTVRRFLGHKKDILSVALSSNNRLIISGSRDYTVKLWNTLGECKGTFLEPKHSSWVSCVKFLPGEEPLILSSYWDGIIKLWKISSNQVKSKLPGHKGYIMCLAVSPDGSLCASGGKDGTVMLWDIQEEKHLYSLESADIITSLCFSPNRYWLCASTYSGIKIWDLETKNLLENLKLNNFEKEEQLKKDISCISTKWTIDGTFFLSGHVDGKLRIWSLD